MPPYVATAETFLHVSTRFYTFHSMGRFILGTLAVFASQMQHVARTWNQHGVHP